MAGADGAPVRHPLHEIDGAALLLGLRSSLAWLQANQEQVNELNVFPVPDGDTGSNMYLTLRSAVEDAQAAPMPGSTSSVMKAAAHGSLMGARGNSGVILSQIFRGFSQALGERERLDAKGVAASLAEGARVAYKAVMKPTEGTILTVVREAAEAAQRAAASSADLRLVLEQTVREAHASVERTVDQLPVLHDAGVVDAGGFGLAVILEGLTRAIAEADGSAIRPVAARRRSGEPQLRQPDGSLLAGGGEAAEPPSAKPRRRRGAAAVARRAEGWGYCTEFVINGPGLDVEALRAELGGLGESSLVVGDPDLVRVHIHTWDPAGLISVASQRGSLEQLKVEDMTAQHHEVLERADRAEAAAERPRQEPPEPGGNGGLPGAADGAGVAAPTGPASGAPATPMTGAGQPSSRGGDAGSAIAGAAPTKRLGVVVVAPGEGFRQIFLSLGADAVVEGGQTMNPSIEDLLSGVRSTGAGAVVILPNNSNVIMTAEQVHQLAGDVEIRVAPSRNVPQGISAMLALDPSADAAANAKRMTEALAKVSAVEVTRAVRDSSVNGLRISAGDVMALIDGDIVQTGDDEVAVVEAVLRNHERPPELVTIYWGSQSDEPGAEALKERIREVFPGTEVEVHKGGQEHYPFILSLE
ncbi:MAG TPA: DAK2 domain-containing protein [Candidatus Binatia bacterium]|nr:DAK2 domain-containing protein [Candidatus Binatia bacterium]